MRIPLPQRSDALQRARHGVDAAQLLGPSEQHLDVQVPLRAAAVFRLAPPPHDLRVEVAAEHGRHGGVLAGAPRGRRAGGHGAVGDVEDGLPALGGGLGLEGFRCLLGRDQRRRGWGDGVQGAFVGLGVADQGGDVVVGEEGVGEYLGRGEAAVC